MADQDQRLRLLSNQIGDQASPPFERDPTERRSVFTHSWEIRGHDADSATLVQRRGTRLHATRRESSRSLSAMPKGRHRRAWQLMNMMNRQLKSIAHTLKYFEART
jgi:hypothetical protein